ncbi:hypothetical protein [Bacillus sp. FJAT-44742]|uniref:hypothetical protein n=1 Tax=Bacillus sp. FJAT-44742 TaxID=2014005 RepID=UPI000C238171|nr:hypothetical protein [Bacillus sp. FJAT-44742]
MNPKLKYKLSILSNELNELVNALYESSKQQQTVSAKLLLFNSLRYLWRRVDDFLSLRGLAGVLVIVVPGWLAAAATNAFQPIIELPLSSMLVLIIIAIVLAGALLRNLVLHEMSSVDSDMFHLEVYEKRKKKEYSSLIPMAREKDFLYILKEQLEQELEQDIEKLREEIRKKNEWIEEKNESIKVKDEAIETLLIELDHSENSAVFFKEKADFMIDILYQLKGKLNLLVNDQFNLDHINFGSSYTIYRIEDAGLFFVGGYGINIAEVDRFIPINDGNNKYIRSTTRSQSNPYIQEDFISWTRTLQDGSQWVLSLHLDRSNRDKLNIKDETGKLNVTIIQEILWICCELLNKFSENSQAPKKGEE